MKLVNFLRDFIVATNHQADRMADDWSAMVADDDDDGDESLFSSFGLIFTFLVAAALFVVIIGGYLSIVGYYVFGRVIPTYEHILNMNTLTRSIYTLTAPLSSPIVLSSFHYMRHACWRLVH